MTVSQVQRPKIMLDAPSASSNAARKANPFTPTELPGSVDSQQDTFESDAGKVVGKQTPLQRHVAFFDRDGDGTITPWETYQGCRAIGCNMLVSAAAATVINGAMAWPTSRSWMPTLNIDVERIHKAMHGSDTRLYNEQGDFDIEAYDDFFARYDKDGDDCWSVGEFLQRTRAQRNVFDLFGQTATVLEFGILYYLVGRNGRISRDSLRKVYDGSLFTELEAERRGKVSCASS